MHIDLSRCKSAESAEVGLFVLKADDVTQEYVSWLNDRDVNEYLESRFVTHTIESTTAFVEANLTSPDGVLFGIRSHLLGKHVGNIRLGHIHPHHRTGEIGILIGDRKAWGKGIASTAIGMVSELARTELSLRKVTAGCYASNVGSLRAFEKAGFVVEAVRKEQCVLNAKPADIVLLGRILR